VGLLLAVLCGSSRITWAGVSNDAAGVFRFSRDVQTVINKT